MHDGALWTKFQPGEADTPRNVRGGTDLGGHNLVKDRIDTLLLHTFIGWVEREVFSCLESNI